LLTGHVFAAGARAGRANGGPVPSTGL